MTQFVRLLICSLFLFSNQVKSQSNVPVGSWKSHFTYNFSNSVELVGSKIFSAAQQLTEYDLEIKEYTTYTKVNGLSDIGIELLRYDPLSGYLYIVYSSGNIDLWKNGLFRNLPDLKNLNVTGSKKINSIFFRNSLAYFCTDFGIVVINPDRREIKESYILQENSTQLEIKGLAVRSDSFFAITNNGMYRADVNNDFLQNFATWKKVDASPYQHILFHENKLYVANDTLLFHYTNSTTPVYESPSAIKRLRSGKTNFYLCEGGPDARSVKSFNSTGTQIDSFFSVNPNDIVEFVEGSYFVADIWRGLTLLYLGVAYPQQPNGIYTNSVYNMQVLDNELYACAGGEVSWIFTFNSGGFSKLQRNGDWKYFNRFVGTPGLDSITDIMDVALDKRNNKLYAASFRDGIWEFDQNANTTVNYKNTPYIQSYSGYRMGGLAMDENNNLWMTNYGAPEQLVVKKADGTWNKFALPYTTSEKAASQIVIDDAGQKWVMAPRGIGVFVFNDNNTIDNKNDDKVKLLRVGQGQGNLPNNEIGCIAKDKNGKIWIGTFDGIAIINCPESIFSAEGCDAELKVVKYDLDAGLLFQREAVHTIAVDGANNKWIGTSNGVWQITDDAERILRRFNSENSPLPSNDVNKIMVHPVTGDVFIATAAGLVSYRGESTEGATNNDDLLIFPNPVPTNYTGTISIRGLVENADVRITDAAGQLVYRTIAQGGQATWNGTDYVGEKPRSGVYFVFVTNLEGTQTKSGKFVIYE